MGKVIVLIILSPVAFVISIVLASEYGGEVVKLQTFQKSGQRFETSLWVVDIHEEVWLRAGDPRSSWLLRLQVVPTVKLERDGEVGNYRAEIVEESWSVVNDRMAEKYGIADKIVSLLREDDQVSAIHLVPLDDS